MTDCYGWDLGSETMLLDKLKADVKTAMRAKDVPTRDAIRMVISELPKLTVPITLASGKKSFRCKTNEEITNEDVLGIIRGLVKSEMATLEAKGETSSDYLACLRLYIPKPADLDEIRTWIKEHVDLSQLKSPMQAMGGIMKHFGQRADGNMVKQVLQEMAKG